MILITGGAGFIGSNLTNELIKRGYEVVICDYKNKINKKYFNNFTSISGIIEPEDLENFIINNNIVTLFHLGAISSTTYPDGNTIWLNNIFLSYKIWTLCRQNHSSCLPTVSQLSPNSHPTVSQLIPNLLSTHFQFAIYSRTFRM